MSADTLLIILLVWSVAGLLAAIAFGKAIQGSSPEEDEGLAPSASTVKYIRRNKVKSHDTSAEKPDPLSTPGKRISA